MRNLVFEVTPYAVVHVQLSHIIAWQGRHLWRPSGPYPFSLMIWATSDLSWQLEGEEANRVFAILQSIEDPACATETEEEFR